VDIVAHSMGGLVVRSFCEKEKEFCKESIRKLITIDTPHLGSELADLLLIYRDQRDKFPTRLLCHTRVGIFVKGSKRFKVDPHPIDKGGVDALAVSKVSDGIGAGAEPPKIGAWQGLSRTDVPVHLIVGDATQYQDAEIKGLWNDLLTPCGFDRTSVFSGEGGDDGIVGVLSQMDGVRGRVLDEDHFSTLESEEVFKEVEKLLDVSK